MTKEMDIDPQSETKTLEQKKNCATKWVRRSKTSGTTK
jgi:hypothetical protein